MNDSVRERLAATPLAARAGPYVLGSWAPAQASAVGAALLRRPGDVMLWMLDERELTALFREGALTVLPPPRESQGGWAVLTLDQTMPWELTGVLAAVSGALATAGVPVGAFSAYSRDHLLVPGARLAEALDALATLCGEVRRLD